MFEPMFDSSSGILGFPAGVVITAIAFGLLIVGSVWVLRITRPEPDPHSFRSTAPRERSLRTVLLPAGVILLALAFALSGLRS